MPTCSRLSSKVDKQQHDSDRLVRLHLASVPAAFPARSDPEVSWRFTTFCAETAPNNTNAPAKPLLWRCTNAGQDDSFAI